MGASTGVHTIEPQPDEAEAAAIAAALSLLATAAPVERAQPAFDAWEASGKLVEQGLEPLKLGRPPSWRTIERLRRYVNGGFYGVIGL